MVEEERGLRVSTPKMSGGGGYRLTTSAGQDPLTTPPPTPPPPDRGHLQGKSTGQLRPDGTP